MKPSRPIAFIILSLALASCGAGGDSSRKTDAENTDAAATAQNRAKYLPSVTGAPGEIFVIIEKNYWEGEIGSELRRTFLADYPFLPQSEQTFSVFNAPHSAFNGSFCLHRNILTIDIDQTAETPEISYLLDVWAHPQIVIRLTAPDKESALAMVTAEKEKMSAAFEQKERDRIINNTHKFENPQVQNAISSFIGGTPFFTKDFSVKKQTNDFIWVSHETTYVNQGMLFFKIPYSSTDTILEDYLDEIDNALQANVPGMRDNSYMVINRYVMPGLKYVSYKERTFIEIRGLWELKNDYMGGPFVCHIFPDRKSRELVVEFGFVYAPKYDKRNYLRFVESVLYSFEWRKNGDSKK